MIAVISRVFLAQTAEGFPAVTVLRVNILMFCIRRAYEQPNVLSKIHMPMYAVEHGNIVIASQSL